MASRTLTRLRRLTVARSVSARHPSAFRMGQEGPTPVLRVISLAQYAIVAARGWAANSINARVGLTAENDRPKQEAQLLCEELRIKDARLAKIDPRRRPYYHPPTERMAILELKAARGGHSPRPHRPSDWPPAVRLVPNSQPWVRSPSPCEGRRNRSMPPECVPESVPPAPRALGSR
jgi:hypothetical protein